MKHWQDILGDKFTDEIGKALNDYVGKNYVSAAEFICSAVLSKNKKAKQKTFGFY